MKFPKIFKVITIVIVLSFLIFGSKFTFQVLAQQCPASDYDCQIAQIQKEIDALTPANENNKKELSSLKTQIDSLNSRIAGISSSLKDVEAKTAKREEDLAFTKEIFDKKAADQYKFIRLYDPLLPFLSSNDASEAFRELTLRQRAVDEDRKSMDSFALELSGLRDDKNTLEKNKSNLASAQSKLQDRQKFLQGEVDKVSTYLGSLSSKQNELAALKAGGFETSVGDTPPSLVPCSGQPGSSNFCDPGFRPAFAAFSFGAPHRTGMSQYGAFGRAKSGQSAETILGAYFQGADLKKDYSEPSTIGVTGMGRVSFEDNYLMGIYEVPESWGDQGGFEALKAQAVAARTYALYATNNGSGSICTTEACQVYKPQLKTGKWADAVRATKGWVLIKDGGPAKAYYASTAGGYTISQWGWNGIKDTIGDWPGTAYEKIAGSPWFYMGWYRARSGASCGRSNPWLTSDDMADILNSWHVLYQGGGDAQRISPTDTSCWQGNPYSKGDLTGIGGFTSVISVNVIYGNSGSTLQVNFQTNKGSVSIPGDEFKKAFNLRAPGYVGLKSSLFNIEKL